MDAWSLMRGDAFIHFVCGSRRVNIRLGVSLLIPKSPHIHEKGMPVTTFSPAYEYVGNILAEEVGLLVARESLLLARKMV